LAGSRYLITNTISLTVTLQEIRKSGLIEYYALGLLDDQDIQRVEMYLIQFSELQKDLLDIQLALQAYATSLSIKPRSSFKDNFHRISQKINNK